MKKEIISRNFSRFASRYETEAKLQLRVAQELIGQCHEFSGTVLDLGAGPGIIAKNSNWDVTSLDISYEMCRLVDDVAVNADIENLPFADNSYPNIISSLSLQWAVDIEKALAEVKRVLKPGGRFAFTTFAPDSLKELKAAFAYIDADQHLMEFEHVIKIFAMLKKAGFANLVMSSQKISLSYPDMLAALRSIKNIGASYGFGAHKSLRGKAYFAKLENVYKGIIKTQAQIPLNWEVLYIHAEKA